MDIYPLVCRHRYVAAVGAYPDGVRFTIAEFSSMPYLIDVPPFAVSHDRSIPALAGERSD